MLIKYVKGVFFFFFFFKFGVEVVIVNKPHTRLKNTDFSNCRLKIQTTQKVRLDLNNCSELYLIRWCVHNRVFNANFDAKFKKTPVIRQADLCVSSHLQ
jgi:hypothetical protein